MEQATAEGLSEEQLVGFWLDIIEWLAASPLARLAPDSQQKLLRPRGMQGREGLKSARAAQFEGLKFELLGAQLRVGRSSKESAQLLDHFAKGNDFWFHVRGYPGSHVIVRPNAGKQGKVKQGVVLQQDVLLSAAHLAAFYSKAAGEKQIEISYTQVKFLHREKKRGKITSSKVLMRQEKNFVLRYDSDLVKKLLAENRC